MVHRLVPLPRRAPGGVRHGHRGDATDPWGKAIQQVYRDLRVMLAEYPELAVVLLLHLKKPQGRGSRRISDVLGEWGRWCDVLVLMEAEGPSGPRSRPTSASGSTSRIVATRAGGMLVDPLDITDKAPRPEGARTRR